MLALFVWPSDMASEKATFDYDMIKSYNMILVWNSEKINDLSIIIVKTYKKQSAYFANLSIESFEIKAYTRLTVKT